ncbi:hypothetical protein H2198_008190 [Neophaeococcomyces mojaviensis]|uniref:Uncharacterized protein n=1 Tax=Neophaeococcomyces mojaviensis TaxID=3383035 RepID=A0ACC2ZY51_9EURO|nr:hypothetical protein H2198_008190 [Knufia sp. JES_112]
MSGMRTHWGLVPGVKNLGAVYNPMTSTLTVLGDGSTNLVVHGFEFVRDEHFVGGLAFSAMCWVGPALEKSKPFRWSNNFHIAYVHGVINLDALVIYTADNPNGEVVDVKWVGTKPPKPESLTAQAPQTIPTAVDIPRPTILNVMVHDKFEITADSKPSRVTVKFDPVCVVLEEANIVDGKLCWKFQAIRASSTSIYVTYGENTSMIGNKRVWDINIGLRASNGGPISEGKEDDQIVLPSFFQSLQNAVDIVQKQWSDAQLYSVQCNEPSGVISVQCNEPSGVICPAFNAYELNNLLTTFRAGDGGHVTIATIDSWDSWGTPNYSSGSIIGNNHIKWPPAEGGWDVALEDAVLLLQDDTRTPKFFTGCSLNEPQHPQEGPVQPIYTFDMFDGSTWIVGAIDKKVWPGRPARS